MGEESELHFNTDEEIISTTWMRDILEKQDYAKL